MLGGAPNPPLCISMPLNDRRESSGSDVTAISLADGWPIISPFVRPLLAGTKEPAAAATGLAARHHVVGPWVE